MSKGTTQWLAFFGFIFTAWYLRKLHQWEHEEEQREKKRKRLYRKKPRH